MTQHKADPRFSDPSRATRVIGQVDLIPMFATMARFRSREQRVQAMDEYFSGITLADSAEQQAKSICLAIATFAVHTREFRAPWRETLSESICQRAKQSKLGARCHVEDIRVLCDVAIAHVNCELFV